MEGWGAPATIKDRDQQMLSIEEDGSVKHKPKLPKKSKIGGFQLLSLSKPVFHGLMSVGYRTPTPIQKIGIPVILSGQDIVAMARTGSGKTACFLLPMFEALKQHSATTGPRALILEPTRELAEQTLKFAQKLGKFTGLHCALVVGGNSMDGQFESLNKHPDIIIATPGRLMHICVEMKLRLDDVQYAVFDEADRLFEMGFREQLAEILDRLAPNRQTLLFSATLPKMLAEFAQAGLVNPAMIRLDKDDKLSEHLQLAFFSIAPAFKLHLLVYILRHVLQNNEQVIVFAATQLNVQYLECVLEKLNIPSVTYLYSAMDSTSRKINVAKFQKNICNVLIATDIAARGIDIPNLDYVINYNFPGTSKTFVHRVGRAARAGRSGTALSFVSSDEEAYMWDLHKFLGRSVIFSPKLDVGIMSRPIIMNMDANGAVVSTEERETEIEKKGDWNFQFGNVPLDIVGEESPRIDRLRTDSEITYLNEKKNNAYKLYERSRPLASKEALREMKEMKQILTPGDHPFLKESVQNCLHTAHKNVSREMMEKKAAIIEHLRTLRPKKTIFELGSSGSKQACRMMQMKRKKDDAYIASHMEKLRVKRAKYDQMQQFKSTPILLPQMDEEDIFYAFPQSHRAQDDIQVVVDTREKQLREKLDFETRKKEREAKRQEELAAHLEKKRAKAAEKENQQLKTKSSNLESGFFIPYQPANMHTERGYSVNGNFSQQSREAQLDLLQDDHMGFTKQKFIKKWDAKGRKKRDSENKIRTESGRLIRGSYMTDRYKLWQQRNKVEGNKEAAGGLEVQEEEKREPNARFKVLINSRRDQTHPLLRDHKKKLADAGHVVREEVRSKQQLKKHAKQQKKYAEDRDRGKEIKKIKNRVHGVATKPRKKTKKNGGIKSKTKTKK